MRLVALGLATALVSLALVLPAHADDEPATAAEPTPRLAELQKHVEHLAGTELMGRGAWEHRKLAADYVIEGFTKAGLRTLPGMASMCLDHEVEGFEGVRNVVAWLPGAKAGTTKEKPGEYVILSSHYDHLGIKRGTDPDAELQVFHGADDNASGVAALIELADMLVKREATHGKLDRSIVFVAFDLEEQQGGVGSHRYVEESPLAWDQLKAFVTMDQLGRSVADVVPGSMFVMGTESCRELRDVIDAVGAPDGGKLIPVGIDFQPGYSDYVPFRAKKVPYVFATSGACANWHQVTDTADKINWSQLEARTRFCRDVIVSIADGEKTFTWLDEPEYHPKEIDVLREVVVDVKENGGERGLPAFAVQMLGNVLVQIDKVLEDGEVTFEERERLRRMTLSLFQLASQVQAQQGG